MESHYTLSDNEFREEYESLTLDSSWFSHEAHLRMTWIYLNEKSLEGAIEAMCSTLHRFDNAFGDGTKYHKTVTIAAVKIVHLFKEKTKAASFAELLEIVPALKDSFKSLIQAHYSYDVFSDSKAKNEFIAPDRLPF